MKKKILSAFLALSMTLGLCACDNTNNNSGTGGNTGGNGGNTGGDKLKIGVIQYAAHPSLDNCYEGIKQGLEESEYKDKYTIDFQKTVTSMQIIWSLRDMT